MTTISIRKYETTVELPDSLPEKSEAYLRNYGATQSLNDAHASVKRSDYESDEEYVEAGMAKVNARLAQLVEGTIGVRVAAPTTPMVRMIAQGVKTLQDQGVSISPDEFAELLARFAESKKAA